MVGRLVEGNWALEVNSTIVEIMNENSEETKNENLQATKDDAEDPFNQAPRKTYTCPACRGRHRPHTKDENCKLWVQPVTRGLGVQGDQSFDEEDNFHDYLNSHGGWAEKNIEVSHPFHSSPGGWSEKNIDISD